MAGTRDIVIIGGGHNGLIAAYYLARAGYRPLVLERRAVAGGAAITDEFHPGFKVSTLAHAAGPLRPDIVRDLDLAKHGLRMINPDPRLFAPAPDGRALVFHDDPARTAESIGGHSKKDAEKYPRFAETLRRLSSVFNHLLTVTPPPLDRTGIGDLLTLLPAGRSLKGLGKKDMFNFFRWAPMAVADIAAEFFETELLRAAIAARGIYGAFLGPWSAGTGTILMLRAAADPHPVGTSAVPQGGLGALTQALAAAAKAAGAEIRTGAGVARILVKGGAATGVVLESGEEITAKTIVSNADPKRTLLGLVEPMQLEPDFVQKLRNYRSNGVSAKVNLALGGLPAFTALKGAADGAKLLAGRIHIGPEIDYLERAYDASKYGEMSEHPYLDVTIPTLSDPGLAPAGKHVMSIHAQYAPYRLKGGDWNARREALGDTVVKTLTAYAPNLKDLILKGEVLTPADLETTYGLTGGHIFHGELALDQLFTMRPLIGWARYRTPIRNLYLCGSGTHPGNGLTGGSGANAAKEILKDLR